MNLRCTFTKINNNNQIYQIMKTQNTPKITKKAVFVYKNIKAKNNYATNPTGDMSHSVVTSFIFEV